MPCSNCELCHKTTFVKVWGCGDLEGEVLFVSDWPYSKDDDKPNAREIKELRALTDGLPFKWRFEYAVKCFPGFSRQKPKNATRKHWTECREYLYETIRKMPNLKLIVALGAKALKFLLPHIQNLESVRGTVQDFGSRLKVYPTFSIKYLFMNPVFKVQVRRDLQDVVEYTSTGRIEVRKLSSDIIITDDDAEIANFLEQAARVGQVASDVETLNGGEPGFRWYRDDFEVSHYGAAISPTDAIVFDPRKHPERYRQFLELKQTVYSAHYEGNIYPSPEKCIVRDPLILGHLVNPSIPSLSLESLTRTYLGKPGWKGHEGNDWLNWAKRCGQDVLLTHELNDLLWAKLDDKRRRLHDRILLPSNFILGSFFGRPLRLDTEQQAKLEEVLTRESEAIAKEIWERWGWAGNIGSPQQVSYFLYKKLGIPVPKGAFSEDGNHSTEAEYLAELSLAHDAPNLVRKWRQKQKLLTNYVFRKDKQRSNKRGEPVPHPQFVSAFPQDNSAYWAWVELVARLCGTVTGRPAFDWFQTLAREPEVRKIIVPDTPSEEVFVEVDLAQIEFVLGAGVLAGDPTLVECFKRGDDAHALTCTKVMGMPLNDENRYLAKAPNFLLLFGGNEWMFQITALKNYNINWSIEEARKIRNDWFAAYPGVAAWHLANLQEIMMYGQITGPTGRVYPIPQGRSFNQSERHDGNKKANNYTCQGGDSDLNLAMAVEAWKLDRNFLRFTFHDACGGTRKRNEAREFAEEWVTRSKEAIDELLPPDERRGIPIRMEAKIGNNLGEMEKVFKR